MSVRGLVSRDEFAHRANNNGTFDSICLHCFGTVASLPIEIDLRLKEDSHLCWQRAESIVPKKSTHGEGRLIAFPRIKQAAG
jgi:hypothetical protein